VSGKGFEPLATGKSQVNIRTAEAGESVEDKERKIVEGIKAHYRMVYDAARVGIPATTPTIGRNKTCK
jgi:hypothetical protein